MSLIGVVALAGIGFPLYLAGTSAEPSSAASLSSNEATLTYIASARLFYLILNGIFRLGIPLLLVPAVLAAHLALKPFHRTGMVIATGFAGATIVVGLALAPIGFSLVGLSDSYMAAPTGPERAAVAASAAPSLRTLAAGEVLCGVLLFGWILITSLIGRKRLFPVWMSSLGIAASVGGPLLSSLSMLLTLILLSFSAFFFSYLIFTPLFFLPLGWFIAFGQKLYKLGRKELGGSIS